MRLVLFALTVGLLSAGPGGYSVKPLRESRRDATANTLEFTKFNNWLNTDYESVPVARRQGPKEHLYSIIDSEVKQIHARTGATFPAEPDFVLAGCFSWAARMGVYGADQVLGRLDPGMAKALGPSVVAPESFQLVLDGDQFVLSSSLGPWRARFPYYFMVGDLRDVETSNGLRTQTAIISTGFGKHKSDEGWSQATVMLVYSPSGTSEAFNEFWLGRFGFTAEDRPAKSDKGLAVYKRFDPKTKLHTDVVFPATEKGAMAVSYMGLDGTYQWNREHFDDFLAMLRVAPEK